MIKKTILILILFSNCYICNSQPAKTGVKTPNPQMNEGEIEMVTEINLMRSNPKEYANILIPYLKEAQDNLKAFGKDAKSYALTTHYNTVNGTQTTTTDTTWFNIYEEEVKAIESLIEDLTKLKPLSILKPSQGIYNACLKHAKDQIPTNTVTHIGTEGCWPWDRILKYSPDMQKGNENIACGPE